MSADILAHLRDARLARDKASADLSSANAAARDAKAALKNADRVLADLLGELVNPRPLLDRIEAKTIEERPDGEAIPSRPSPHALAMAIACPTCGVFAGQICKGKSGSKGPLVDGLHLSRYGAARSIRTMADGSLCGDQLDTELLVAAWGGNWRSVGLLAIFPRETDADPGTPEGEWIDRIHKALGLPSHEEPTIGQLFAWLEGRSIGALPGLTYGDRVALQEAVGNFCLFVPEAQDDLRGEWLDTPEFEPEVAEPAEAAWRSLSLLDLVADAPWPDREASEAARSARLALAEPAGNTPGITTLGHLIDCIEGRDGHLGGPLDEIVIARPDGEPGIDGSLTDAEVKALRFALHSRREVDPEFARDVEAWAIDPTLRSLLFRVELRPQKKGEPRDLVYLRANSKLIATEYAQANWGDSFKAIWEVNADKSPEGATVFDIPLDSYDDRLAQHRFEARMEEQERQEAMARAKAEKEPEPCLFAVTPKGKRAPSCYVEASSLSQAIALMKSKQPDGPASKVRAFFGHPPKGSVVHRPAVSPAKEVSRG